MTLKTLTAALALSLFAAGPALAAQPVPAAAYNLVRLSNQQVKQMQAALQMRGFYQNGQIDGIVGRKTLGAVTNFQHSAGLAPTGVVNEPTLAALNVPGFGPPRTTTAMLSPPHYGTSTVVTQPPATVVVPVGPNPSHVIHTGH